MAYLKVLLDEIFVRKNFINTISIKAKVAGVTGSNLGKSLQDNVEYVLLYAKNITSFNMFTIPQKKQELMSYIKSYINDNKSWKYTSVMLEKGNREFIKEFTSGNGDVIKLYKHVHFKISSINQIAKEEFNGDVSKVYYKYIDKILRTTNAQTSIRTKVIEEIKEFANGKGLFSIDYVPIKGKNVGNLITSYYKDNNLIAWLKDVVKFENNKIYKMDNIGNLWDDIQYNNLTKEGKVQFPNGKKPEMLIERLLNMCTEQNDYVLDSFLGSGTTCAVAHKMNRKWIGIEMGEQVFSHCIPRINSIIDNTDTYGVKNYDKTNYINGYNFYELAPSLLEKDKFDELVINKKYNLDMLSEAVALHEGFDYSPSKLFFWKQAKGKENSFLYVTLAFIDHSVLENIYNQMAENEYLIIYCSGYENGKENQFKRIKIKKIPEALLAKCEYGKDDYKLNVPDIFREAENEEC